MIRLNLDSALKGDSSKQNNHMQEILNNMSNDGPIVRGNIKTPLERSQKKECGCESTVLIVDDNFFNLVPLELILRETYQLQVDKA